MNIQPSRFKEKYSFYERYAESKKVIEKYPDKIPIICEKSTNNKNNKSTPNIDKNKFLVPDDLLVSQFMFVIRKRLKLPDTSGIFLFINSSHIPKSSSLIRDLYREFKNEDGFLYITYSNENVFG